MSDGEELVSEQDTKSPKNPIKPQMPRDNPRSSIVEFEKLEQECIDKSAKKHQPKRKKKLFDDSDSEENQEE